MTACCARVVGDEQASATQLRDGTVVVQGPSEASVERLRWLLAVDDDHSEFLRRFKNDKLLSGPISHLQGKRVLRVGTVAQSLLRALCGQLIEAWRARAMEKRIIRSVGQPVGDLHAPPDCATLARCSRRSCARSGCMPDAAQRSRASAARSSSSGSRTTPRASWPSD